MRLYKSRKEKSATWSEKKSHSFYCQCYKLFLGVIFCKPIKKKYPLTNRGQSSVIGVISLASKFVMSCRPSGKKKTTHFQKIPKSRVWFVSRFDCKTYIDYPFLSVTNKEKKGWKYVENRRKLVSGKT